MHAGLRLHDNPALLEALQDAEHLFPVFCLDPGIIAKKVLASVLLYAALRKMSTAERKRLLQEAEVGVNRHAGERFQAASESAAS